jgi:Cu(I)/Ag(I) efflux system periplasmic protein CusF
VKTVASVLAAAALVVVAPATAQKSADDHSAHHALVAQAAQTDALADGEIRRVDKEAKKLTIKHGPIPNLDMPAMTMVFQVKDPAMLDQVKAGDKVKFQAEKAGGQYTVTNIQK